MSRTVPSHVASAPRPRRRHLLLPVLALLGVLLACSVGAAAAVHGEQQRDLSAAGRDRGAAQHVLDAAVARAQDDGVTLAQLEPVLQARAAILAEPSLHPAVLGFDAGERAHLGRQAAALRALVGRVDTLQQAATDAARVSAGTVMAQLQAAVATAQKAGVDVSGDLATIQSTQAALDAARSPKAVDVAMIGIADRIGGVQQRTQDKLAADAALSSAQLAAENALARADRLVAAAQPIAQIQPTAAPWLAAIAAQHQALLQATAKPQFDAVTAATKAAADPLSSLLTARGNAYGAMAAGRQAVTDAGTYKVDPGTIPAQLDALQAQLDQAATAAQFGAVTAQVNALIAPLLDRLGIAELGVGKVIVVNLQRQSLTAYQDGQAVYTTLVTTGRPALPTPPGNYRVLRKNHPWEMVSDFPPSSPYWYPPTWVQYTLWFRNDGYAIHDAPWRSAYGPGTEQAGSHGCVNVPMPIMQAIYNWAEVGTRVIVH